MYRQHIRGIRVARKDIPQVKLALARKGLTQKGLAEDVGLSLSTVHGFLNGKPVERLNFIEISQILGLDWQAILDLTQEFPDQ
jgi:transcriptional regulator with XRE-family HTH domain